jgi:hypothetical protein
MEWMTMSKIDVKDFICRPFCRFFKEGEKEEMECMGARVIEDLMKRGILMPDLIPAGRKDPSLWKKRDPLLLKNVCGRCEFRIGGCDYMSDSPPPDAEPCGGNILLSLLLLNNIIRAGDLENLYDC